MTQYNPTRRKALIVAGAALGLAWTGAAMAQGAGDYPARPITMIVPFSAGGSTDVLARLVAEGMSNHLGQRVVVENAPGAGGVIAGRRALTAAADGYTILIGNTGTLAANAGFYKKKPFDVPTDFAGIASVGDAPQIVVARKTLPVSGLDSFAAYARENSQKMTVGAAGVGSGSYLGAALLSSGLNVKVQVVNYRGSGDVMNDIMAGNIDYMVESSTAALPHVTGGTLKGVAVLQKERIAQAKDIPAAGESAFPDVAYKIWNAVVVPARTPAPIVAKLNDSIRKTLADATIRKRITDLGLEIPSDAHQTADGTQKLLRDEQARWLPLVGQLGVSLD